MDFVILKITLYFEKDDFLNLKHGHLTMSKSSQTYNIMKFQ